MTPRKISVHQLAPGSALRDGVLDAMLAARRMLVEFGFNSEVFIDSTGGTGAAPIRPAGDLRPRPHDIVLIHHRGGQERLDRLAALHGRKVLVYHGIPTADRAPAVAHDDHERVTAFAQLGKLRSLVEASIAVSSRASRQLRQRGFEPVTLVPFTGDWSEARAIGGQNPLPAEGDPAIFSVFNVGPGIGSTLQRELVSLLGSGLALDLVFGTDGACDPDYKTEIERKLRAAHLAGCIHWAEITNTSSLIAQCRVANAYVADSDCDEGNPAALAAMALDVPVIARVAPGMPADLQQAGISIPVHSPAEMLQALHRLQHDPAFRREIIRRQRAYALGLAEIMRRELRQWLVGIGAYETRPLIARLVGWAAPTLARRHAEFPALPAAPDNGGGGLQSSTRYLIERDISGPQAFDETDRRLARALAQRRDRTASVGQDERGVGLLARIVTIRRGCAPSATAMLGDIRLFDLIGSDGVMDARGARLINNRLDGVLVGSEFAKRNLRNSGVRLPVSVIRRPAAEPNHALRARRRPAEPVGAAAPFTFLHNCRGPAAAGVEEVLSAYCLAFTGSAPVLLVVNAAEEAVTLVQNLVKRLAGGAFAPAVQVIAGALSRSEAEVLLGVADAILLPVTPDAAEAAATAMAHRVPVIAAGYGGQLEFCSSSNATLVDYEFDVAQSLPELSAQPRIRFAVPQLMAAMKLAYRDGRDCDAPTARRARRAESDVAALGWPSVAETIDEFVDSLDNRPVMNSKIRLAWISTYNSRCGLATHSEHLLEHFDRSVFDVTVIGNHQEPLRPDPENLVRLWPDRAGSLASVREYIRNFDAVFINFHFSLMDIQELAQTLQMAQTAAIDAYVTLHKTIDTVIDGRSVSLREIADELAGCTRLIVHTEADIARLKAFGVIDNVVMIPPGVIDRPPLNPSTLRSLLGLQPFRPIIGSFGFMLPPKGLQQLIHAFALLLRHYPDAMLLMLNAEYPGAVESIEERERCVAMIQDLGLTDRVKLIHEFLETDEILLLLNACDLSVFTYQSSGESDSGAVRLGLAAGRPVATTPVPVFANLAGVVHQLSGTTAADIAEGVLALLQDPELAAAVERRQRHWIDENSWAAQAVRIGNIIRGGFEERHDVYLGLRGGTPPDEALLGRGLAPSEGAGAAHTLREMIAAAAPPRLVGDVAGEEKVARQAR